MLAFLAQIGKRVLTNQTKYGKVVPRLEKFLYLRSAVLLFGGVIMFLSRFDENAMKSFEEVLKQNPNILEQIRKETDEWLKELEERYTNG